MSHSSFSSRSAVAALGIALAASLAGCASSHIDQLQQYAKAVEARQKPRVEPLPQFVPYETFLYQDQAMRDPFTPPSFAPPAAVPGTSTSGIHPDFSRPREPLEQFPLDSLRMVGTLARGNQEWALVESSDNVIHRVQVGNYLGQNNGKITRITESEIDLTEIVPDGMGGWMERHASLALSQ